MRPWETYYQPQAGDFVTILTPRAAEEHDRRVMSIPPGVGLGWTPNTVRVLRGGSSLVAFQSRPAFRRWLTFGRGLRLRLAPHHFRGLRTGTIQP